MKNIAVYVDEYKKKAETFANEEEVRIGTNELIKEFIQDFEIASLEESHETTSIHGGRADSIFSDIVIEYKIKGTFKSKKGRDEAVYGRDAKDRGLKHYLINFTLDEYTAAAIDDSIFCSRIVNKVGIGFDGEAMIIARFVPDEMPQDIFSDKKTKKLPKQLSEKLPLRLVVEFIDDLEVAFKKMVLLLRSTDRYCLSSKNLIKEFGPGSEICRETIQYLYGELEREYKANTRINTLYREWLRIFGDIYGKKETDFTQYRASLAKMYGMKANLDPQKTLFIIQTYYNIVLKLLIFKLLESLTDPTRKSRAMGSMKEIISLFSGDSYSRVEVDNFFEVHFFEWFLFDEAFDEKFINDIEIKLDNFETTTSVIKSEVVEDVLRDVYANLIPTDLRHLMGEYYTCGWLVDFTLNKVNYEGQRGISLLDPTCGSGSFITHAIKRFRQKNSSELSNEQIIEEATKNIAGYDINPIAVISAKTNYLLSLGDISTYEKAISLPVYMCDSVLVPTVYAKQNKADHCIKVKTVVGTFEIPVMKDRAQSDLLLNKVYECIYKEYTYDQFYDLTVREKQLDYDGIDLALVKKFYEKILELHKNGKNGFWGVILKNAFAPLFAKDGFDIVIGNPPWIGWKSMSDTYRKQTLDVWMSYDIFEKSAYDKITSHDDFAMAVVYVSMDHYVKENGKIGFVLPQTFVKSPKGGEGFRKFVITRDGMSVPFCIEEVYDMDAIKPFRKFATNKASVMIFKKNKKMVYPMHNYYLCLPAKPKEIVDHYDTFTDAMSKIRMEKQSAKPISAEDDRSPWLTFEEKELTVTDKYRGKSAYKGRKGIEPCGAKGTYLVDVKEARGNCVLIENLVERARLQKAKDLGVHPGMVEKDLVYPMIGGRNISKWGVNSHLYMVVPHNNSGEGIYRGMDEGTLKVSYPKTYDWLFYFKDLLTETRVRSAKFFDLTQFPWYRLDNVGDYTFQNYHVVWREQSKSMTACVIGSLDDPYLGKKVMVTDSKVLSCATDDLREAHYICAIINSPRIISIIDAYTIDTQRGVDILNNIAIPEFDPENEVHVQLSGCSAKAHELFLAEDKEGIAATEREIDELVEKLFV